MKPLKGKISDRMRSGELPPDILHKRPETNETPSPEAVRAAKGQGLGEGATKRRTGGPE